SSREPTTVGEDSPGHSFGHDRPYASVDGRCPDRFFPAHGHVDNGNPAGIPSTTPRGKIRNCADDVLVAVPAEVHRRPVAVSVASGIDKQDAEAMSCQDGSLRQPR